MEALILAALLNMPITATCQQWLDRLDQESKTAARLVWSPQKQRHIERMNRAAEMVNANCYFDTNEEEDQVADANQQPLPRYSGAGF